MFGADHHFGAGGRGRSWSYRGIGGQDILAAHEAGDEFVVGVAQEGVERAGLLEDALVENAGLVGYGEGLFEVVADVDDGKIEVTLHSMQQGADSLARSFVEGADGLIEKQHLGLEHEGAGEGGALLFAAAEVGDAAFEQGLDAQHIRGAGYPGGYVAIGVISCSQAEGDVLLDGEVRKQGVVLRDVADGASAGLEGGDVAGIDEDASGVGAAEAAEALEKDGLAGAGRAEHDKVRAAGDLEAEVAEVEVTDTK